MIDEDQLAASFTALTGENRPFRWQARLLSRLVDNDLPTVVDIPTGLGKTHVMALWAIALAQGTRLPRRLVYVVDRRTVVDQATRVAERLRDNMTDDLARGLGLGKGAGRLPISTLRGEFADNGDWLEDPATPAVVVGTIDMIGSRLLFEGYGVSRGMRPYHAGMLGVDTLVLLDEAHLCPPFEALLRQVAAHRDGKLGPKPGFEPVAPVFRLMSLSATGRDVADVPQERVFRLEDSDREEAIVRQRLTARKWLTVIELKDEGSLPATMAKRAVELGCGAPSRVLTYCDRREDAVEVKGLIDMECKRRQKAGKLATAWPSELLVGERRVYERTKLQDWLDANGYLGDANTSPSGSAFLVATSAGEVGVDLDADHMVCDLVAYERMVQRLGRVNRRGGGNRVAAVDVFAVRPPDPKANARKAEKERHEKDLETFGRRLAALRELHCGGDDRHDASPAALAELNATYPDLVNAATTPAPLHPELTRPLLDAWSMTSLEEHTGRPSIQPWLRGWVVDHAQTTVVWRRYLPMRDGVPAAAKDVEAFFKAAPPHISERLEAETNLLVARWLVPRAKRLIGQHGPALLQADVNPVRNGPEALPPLRDGDVIAFVLSSARRYGGTLTGRDLDGSKHSNEKLRELLSGSTLILDARFGGLSPDGTLDRKTGNTPRVVDDGLEWLSPPGDPPLVRFRVRSVAEEDHTEPGVDWRERYRYEADQTDSGEATRWLVVEKWRHDGETEQDRSAGNTQELAEHQVWTERYARAIAAALQLPSSLRDMLAIAAKLHDEGKRHQRWQRAFNAPRGDRVYAKTKGPISFKLLHDYRHEFGSLPLAEKNQDLKALPADLQDLALHLIAAHHGHARPTITTAGCDAPQSVADERAREVALRFARLQKRWGPWGLAWWEALLRAADQQASRDNDDPVKRLNRPNAEEYT